MTRIDPNRVAALLDGERTTFAHTHRRSAGLAERAGRSLLGGVPMNWMTRWSGGHPVFVASAAGAEVVDVDGNRHVDLCLGDTGAMTGHSPAATVAAIVGQADRGLTTMLPSEDAVWVGEELARRFGLPLWQIATTATDANRFALRIAREVTGRQRVLVFNWCYHGSVDEALVVLDDDGAVVPRPGRVGPPVAPGLTTQVVEFNDVPALERALAAGDIAAVLTEPALTNIGIVGPDPGFHDVLRSLTTATGTLLIIDETHTICAGPGGCTARDGLRPDLLTIGKPIGGGVPAAAFGMTAEVAGQMSGPLTASIDADVSGVGGTLSGSALAMAAVRATLAEVLTDAAFEHMIPLAERWATGVNRVIEAAGLDWHVHRLGCRAEYWFGPPPRNGGQAAAAVDHDLENLLHLWALNRGVLLTPFHNMALMSPATTEAHVDRHTEVFASAVDALVAR